MVNQDFNRLIGKLEDARTSIEEARTKAEGEDRDNLLDDAIADIDMAVEELEDEGKGPNASGR